MKFGYFPWKFFWKTFWAVMLVLNGTCILTLGVASFVFDFSFYAERPAMFFLMFVVLSALASALFSYRFVLPLKSVILKALRIASKKYVTEFEEEDVLIDEDGEYGELERALDKIRRKLKRRRMQLSHEREEYQALMGSMEDAIVSVNLDERLVFFNSQFAAQFLSRESGLPEGQLRPLTQSFRQPEIVELFEIALRQGEVRTRQVRLKTYQSAQPLYFSVRVSPLREEKTREIYGALGVFHDITDIKRAEQIRMEFVENASHELRTPLTSMKGFVETLIQDVAEGRLEQAPQFLSIIAKSVNRLTELVNDMLTISSLESNASLKMSEINLQELTEDVISRLSNLASAKRILVKMRIETAELKADESKVEQVLSNLIENAIKYIPEGSQIEIQWTKNPNGEVLLRVQDNGSGIPVEHQSRLFERFYRVDKGRSRDVGGTGLGLAIVKHIMQSHGGTVCLKSEPGRGAEFTCYFPLLLS